jgi:hypothetical protein
VVASGDVVSDYSANKPRRHWSLNWIHHRIAREGVLQYSGSGKALGVILGLPDESHADR